MRSTTTEGSASVDVSPSSLTSLAATLRRTLRMILPDRVLGRPDDGCEKQAGVVSEVLVFVLRMANIMGERSTDA